MGFSLKGILSSGVTEAVKTISDVADKWIDTKADKAQRDLELQKILIDQANKQAETAQLELDSYLKDVQDSRLMNARIQETTNASWMSKNVGYLIDAVVISAFISMLVIIVYKVVPIENKDLFNIGFGALGSYVATVIGWHRGSSASSKANGDIIRQIAKK